MYYANQYVITYLSVTGGIDNSQTTGIVVQSANGIDTTKPGIACINWADPLDEDLAEWIFYTSIDVSNEFQGVTRGAEKGSAKSHSNGVAIAFPASETHINQFADIFHTSAESSLAENLLLKETASAPTTPAAGYKKIYMDTDDKLYTVDDAGVAKQILQTGDVTISTDGWTDYDTVVPTRASADDPTYVLTFAGVDLTGVIYPGMRVKWTQNSTVRYGIVTKMAFSTDTTMTIYGGTDYDVDDTATYAISAFAYSTHKAPAGFPLQREKWSVLVIDSSNRSQASPTNNVYYNLGSIQISVPIGSWELSYGVKAEAQKNASIVADIFVTLSANSSAEDEDEFSDSAGFITASGNLLVSHFVFRTKSITLATKGTYYLIAKTTNAVNSIAFRGDEAATVVRAVCAYL